VESRDANLVDWYLLIFKEMQDRLRGASQYIIADPYFSKNSFAVGVQAMEFDLISCFRNDVTLYLSHFGETYR